MRAAHVDPATVDAGSVAFRLAPRINAAGRLGHPGVALDLLLTEDAREADRLAGELRGAGMTATLAEDGLVTVEHTTPAAVGARAFAAGVELHELRPRTSGLEELYFQLTAGQEQFAATDTSALTTGNRTSETRPEAAR